MKSKTTSKLQLETIVSGIWRNCWKIIWGTAEIDEVRQLATASLVGSDSGGLDSNENRS
jgi:hypothetical protein